MLCYVLSIIDTDTWSNTAKREKPAITVDDRIEDLGAKIQCNELQKANISKGLEKTQCEGQRLPGIYQGRGESQAEDKVYLNKYKPANKTQDK